MLVPSLNPRGAVQFLQALRDLQHLPVGRPGDSDQQVQQGEDLLARLTHLAASDKFPANQALACQKALLELKLCKPEQALVTVLQFVTEEEVAAARWAVHLAAHIYWLEGHVDQVHLLAHAILGFRISGGAQLASPLFPITLLASPLFQQHRQHRQSVWLLKLCRC